MISRAASIAKGSVAVSRRSKYADNVSGEEKIAAWSSATQGGASVRRRKMDERRVLRNRFSDDEDASLTCLEQIHSETKLWPL